MVRRLLSFAATFSLVLFVALVALWVRQPGGRWRIPGTHFRAESQSRGLAVYGPPGSPSGRAPWPALRQLVSHVRNDQLRWQMSFRSADNDEFQTGGLAPRQGTPAARLAPLGEYQSLPNEAVPLLLDALDDPNRFAAAHVILSNDRLGWIKPATITFRWDDYPLRGSGTFEGLSAKVTIPKSAAPSADASVNPVGGVDYDVAIDPAQLPAIRELWHRRLDQEAFEISYARLAAVLLICPGLWALTTGTRSALNRRKRRRQICLACGYDLRATPGRCPECGWTG